MREMIGTTVCSRRDVRTTGLRARVGGVYGLLGAGNLAAWLCALIAFRDSPILLGMAFLAYSFGLRHGFDADHIAAIDNVTRKLVEEGRRPVAAGLFFSLGHATMVVALVGVFALAVAALASRWVFLRDFGGIVGPAVSALFLLAIAAANGFVLIRVYQTLRSVRRMGAFVEDDLERILATRGGLGRIFSRLFRLISRSWHMYPLGLLFGLGFDTASEVGVLGVSASQATHGLSIGSILIFPALFAAGMSLVDTTDGVIMLGAYRWASLTPARRLSYNLVVTALSVVAALAIAGVETLDLVAEKLRLDGPFWRGAAIIGDNFSAIGGAIVALFVGGWLVAVLVDLAKRRTGLGATGQHTEEAL